MEVDHEERKDHSGYKTNTSMPVLISTLFYVFLASLLLEGDYGLVVNWWDHFP